MRLRERLSQLDSALRQKDMQSVLFPDMLDERKARIARLRSLIAEVAQREAHKPAVAARAEGPRAFPFATPRETEAGTLHVVERWLEPRHCHGRVRVAEALALDPRVIAELALDPTLAQVDVSRMLILDTETTGLSGGAGTVPFLIGLGSFEDGALKLEQLFLPNLGGEAPLLAHLARRIGEASCIVSYNGKAFDWPLLRARFILHRIAVPNPPPHLDLLHGARRAWKRRLSSVRLIDVERSLLGFHREDDVDGSEIPGRYLAYLRGGDPELLVPVLDHNQKDVIALAAVLFRLCAHYAEMRPADDPSDHLSYAEIALRIRDLERAHEFARAVLAGSCDRELVHGAWQIAAGVARLRGETESALEAWRCALEFAGDARSSARAQLALARLYERKLKRYADALRHARFTAGAEGPHSQGRRLGRLHRRLLDG